MSTEYMCQEKIKYPPPPHTHTLGYSSGHIRRFDGFSPLMPPLWEKSPQSFHTGVRLVCLIHCSPHPGGIIELQSWRCDEHKDCGQRYRDKSQDGPTSLPGGAWLWGPGLWAAPFEVTVGGGQVSSCLDLRSTETRARGFWNTSSYGFHSQCHFFFFFLTLPTPTLVELLLSVNQPLHG